MDHGEKIPQCCPAEKFKMAILFKMATKTIKRSQKSNFSPIWLKFRFCILWFMPDMQKIWNSEKTTRWRWYSIWSEVRHFEPLLPHFLSDSRVMQRKMLRKSSSMNLWMLLKTQMAAQYKMTSKSLNSSQKYTLWLIWSDFF